MQLLELYSGTLNSTLEYFEHTAFAVKTQCFQEDMVEYLKEKALRIHYCWHQRVDGTDVFVAIICHVR